MLLDSLENFQRCLMRGFVTRPMSLFEILVDSARDRSEDLSSLRVVGVGEDDVVSRGFDVQGMGGSSLDIVFGFVIYSFRLFRDRSRCPWLSTGLGEKVIQRPRHLGEVPRRIVDIASSCRGASGRKTAEVRRGIDRPGRS